MKIVEYDTKQTMLAAVAEAVRSDLEKTLAEQDRASIAVPGGTTPGPIFDILCETDLDWGRTTVILSDERWVPGDHERSNTRLLYERLLIETAGMADYISLYTGDEDANMGAEIVSSELDAVLPLDVLVLGMGADMHTASLFPAAENLEVALADDAPNVVAIFGGGATEPRVSLSARVLRNAKVTHIVISGAEKRAALDKAVELDDPYHAPICSVLENAIVHWAKE